MGKGKDGNTIFDQSWQPGEVPNDQRKINITPIFRRGRKKDPGNYRATHQTLGKVMEQLILEAISRHTKNKKITRTYHHVFTMLGQLDKILP